MMIKRKFFFQKKGGGSSQITKELVEIIEKLNDNNIGFEIEDNFVIKIKELQKIKND